MAFKFNATIGTKTIPAEIFAIVLDLQSDTTATVTWKVRKQASDEFSDSKTFSTTFTNLAEVPNTKAEHIAACQAAITKKTAPAP